MCLPLAIMTSDDTHARTAALLESHGRFGLAEGQITLIKQEKARCSTAVRQCSSVFDRPPRPPASSQVPCLSNNDAHVALDPANPFAIQTKPHGHGDVHALLHSSGLAAGRGPPLARKPLKRCRARIREPAAVSLRARWLARGLKWVVFFQDTNALVFKAIPSALGVSARSAFDVNSLAVPRKAKEAIGGIARLVRADGSAMTVNVEYNQLDPLLRATTYPEGTSHPPSP